jgi:DNA-binding NtrC family response regulator
MDKELRILMLEDVADDAELTERELRKGGLAFSAKRVETRKAFLEALKDFLPDLILADYSLPTFDSLSALAIVEKECPDTPFIFVSGTIGEDFAIETLKRGATDYVLKNRLSRLVPAVIRALREVEERAERKREEEELWALSLVLVAMSLWSYPSKVVSPVPRRSATVCKRILSPITQKEVAALSFPSAWASYTTILNFHVPLMN